ncbi:MAG: YcxB family protein [Lachnospiraceae bacterium]|nr:YcxB family protein [Lachnospiraceae bacterium]
MEEDKIVFSVQLTATEIFQFNMYHLYSSPSGGFGVLLSLMAWIMLVVSFDSLSDQSKTVLTFLGLWFILLYPLILYARAKGQVKRNQLGQSQFGYQLDSTGITVSRGEEQQTIGWEQLVKIVETRTQYFVYSSRVHAFIFPKQAMKEDSAAFNEQILHYIEGTQIRLKGRIRKQKIKGVG